MIAPSSAAILNSSGGVSLEENMIFSPSYFIAFAIISSVSEEQSTPHPSFFKISITNGFGVAFTAKYSLNPLFQENARIRRSPFSRIPFSSYRWNGVGYVFLISSSCSRVTNGFFSTFTSSELKSTYKTKKSGLPGTYTTPGTPRLLCPATIYTPKTVFYQLISKKTSTIGRYFVTVHG